MIYVALLDLGENFSEEFDVSTGVKLGYSLYQNVFNI